MKNELEKYLAAIVEDYRRWDSKYNTEERIQEFANGLSIIDGQKYLKVVSSHGSSRSVHSFIVKEDGGKFKAGDILKAAGWAAPAKNKARGNIFGEYRVRWTGAEYLR